jgi:hypothetical protein
MSTDQLLKESQNVSNNSNFYIIVPHNITQELYRTILQVAETGNDLAIVLIRDVIGPEEEDILQHLKLAGILHRQVTREDEIAEVLIS